MKYWRTNVALLSSWVEKTRTVQSGRDRDVQEMQRKERFGQVSAPHTSLKPTWEGRAGHGHGHVHTRAKWLITLWHTFFFLSLFLSAGTRAACGWGQILTRPLKWAAIISGCSHGAAERRQTKPPAAHRWEDPSAEVDGQNQSFPSSLWYYQNVQVT